MYLSQKIFLPKIFRFEFLVSRKRIEANEQSIEPILIQGLLQMGMRCSFKPGYSGQIMVIIHNKKMTVCRFKKRFFCEFRSATITVKNIFDILNSFLLNCDEFQCLYLVLLLILARHNLQICYIARTHIDSTVFLANKKRLHMGISL